MSGTRTAPDEVRIIERMLAEGFAGGDIDIVDELCSTDIVEHQLGLSGTGAAAIEKVKGAMLDVHRAMPDLRFTVEDWAVADDIVWVRATGEGTNTGPFMGPPTGKSVHFTVIDIARVADGRIVEHWGVPDRFAILLQLGRLG
ncbi:hypothetical protein ASF88_09440 [Leifsonia sp. Leaf336]|uniref:ester cyclase n=1 Tax=Leifsonia sp. Leaf336 TaxID=1736341 RepID=UPI0006F30495|nr:ester cyclase [Leifsonia sp. Leaf336]KQR51826.1 hypothetical protein ASF88_09440 [Leifsonia sp. Leaf336]